MSLNPTLIEKKYQQKSQKSTEPKETIDWKWEISGLKDSLDFLRAEMHSLVETMEGLKEVIKDANK